MKRNLWKGYALVVTGALALSVTHSVRRAEAGPQPHIANAKQMLENAVKQLGKAKGSFGGHRVKAIELTQQAIAEANLALEADRANPSPAPVPVPAPPSEKKPK